MVSGSSPKRIWTRYFISPPSWGYHPFWAASERQAVRISRVVRVISGILRIGPTSASLIVLCWTPTTARLVDCNSISAKREDRGSKRIIYPPGFRWSTHMQPVVKTELCMHAHAGFLAQGRVHVQYEDGDRKRVV